MKEFTMSMFKSKEELYKAKADYYEDILLTHKRIFEWVERNPGMNINNMRYEILQLLKELKDL